jgi:hypothetical protein
MPTIEVALQRFLDLVRDQYPDEAEDTQLTVDNLRSYLDGYGYQYVDDEPDDDDDGFDEEFDEDDYDEPVDDFAAAHGTEMLPVAMAEFLYSWNIRKFMGTADDARMAGLTVTRLMELLVAEGWADREDASEAAELGRTATDELPRANELSHLLYELAEATPHGRADEIEEDVDDFLQIARIEPGRIWFSEDVGPIEVPEEASRLAQVGWWVNLAAQRRAGTWFITETGFVYPRMIGEGEDEGEDDDWEDLLPGSPSPN